MYAIKPSRKAKEDFSVQIKLQITQWKCWIPKVH